MGASVLAEMLLGITRGLCMAESSLKWSEKGAVGVAIAGGNDEERFRDIAGLSELERLF